MDPGVQTYLDAMAAENRPLFDRVHRLIVGEFPDVGVGIAYKMPVYRRAGRSLNVGAWTHGISFYGWTAPGAVSLLERHPELSSGKGTLRIPLTLAEDISDAELLEVIQGSLSD